MKEIRLIENNKNMFQIYEFQQPCITLFNNTFSNCSKFIQFGTKILC